MHPSPYLQVALPLIEDVKGGEGLSSLWRVFTKCQESIQDGSRLENISWRLWYKSLHPSSPSPTDSLHVHAHHPFASTATHAPASSIAGSSFTESLASSFLSSEGVSERDFVAPQAGEEHGAPMSAHRPAARSEPVTPANHDAPHQASSSRRTETVSPTATASTDAALRPSRPPIVRASFATPQHASTGDLASVVSPCSTLLPSSSTTNADGSAASLSGRPALGARAKSTPRLQSASPYETPALRPARSSRPLAELDGGGISFGRVLGHVYKEGTVGSMVRRGPRPAASASAAATAAPAPSAPSARSSLTSAAAEDNVPRTGRDLRRTSDALDVVGPAIRVIDPTPVHTTPSTPAPGPHANLWAGGEADQLAAFEFGRSQERTPRPRRARDEHSPTHTHPSPTSATPRPSRPSSPTLSSEPAAFSSVSHHRHPRASPEPEAKRPFARSAGQAANDKSKLFFISPDNGDGSGGSCSSLDDGADALAAAGVGADGAEGGGLGIMSGDGQEQKIGSPESLEDGGLQMKRKPRTRSPVPFPLPAAADAPLSSASTAAPPPSAAHVTPPLSISPAAAARQHAASPPRHGSSPSYAPLASSPLKQTTVPQPSQPSSPPPAPAPAPPAGPAPSSAEAPAPLPPPQQQQHHPHPHPHPAPPPAKRQHSISSATPGTSRRSASTSGGPSASRPAGKAPMRRKSGPARVGSSIAMTKASVASAAKKEKEGGAMAPPPAPPAAAAASAAPPAPPPIGPRRTSSGSGKGRFAQEKARAASAINAAASSSSAAQGKAASSSSAGAVVTPPPEGNGNAVASSSRPSIGHRRTSSSALMMTSSKKGKAPAPRPASEHGDDEGDGGAAATTGGAAASGGSDEGDWADDTESSALPTPVAPARRRSVKRQPTKYTAAMLERARQTELARFAEEEAERQKSLFRKVPVSKSAADLYGLGREAAASPAPATSTATPSEHSTGNIAGGRSSGLLSDMFKVEREKREGVYHQRETPLGHNRNHSSSQDLWQHGRDIAAASSKTAGMIPRNKSAAALPQATGFTVGRGDDLETESEAETHGSADKIVLGTSEAQRRLANLAAKKPAAAAPRHHGLSAMTAMTPVSAAERHQQHKNYPPTTRPLPPRPDSAPPVASGEGKPEPVAAEQQQQPVDLPPLPAPSAAPQSPRTTRRQMLAAELPEELRKQLLWERMSRQRVYGGGTISRSNSTPRLNAEASHPADRPSVTRNAATESAPVSRAPSDSSSPPPVPQPPLAKRNSGVLGANILRPLTAAGHSPPSTTTHRARPDPTSPNGQHNPYFEKVKASRKVGDGPLQAYRSGPSATNLTRLHQPSESSSDSDDETDALTLLKRRNTHHGELHKLADSGWDADYRSHGF